jgi:serine phosphatase RsbU (regulator of sigma subunit)
METLQKANHSLSPLLLPNWPQIEIGVAKGRGKQQLGLYYDLFRLPDNTFVILLASTTSSSPESIFSIAQIRGMVRMHVSDFTPGSKTAFSPTAFIQKLNRIIQEDSLGDKFAMSLLRLDPLKDLATYISCGFGPLLHIPQGRMEPRMLASPNDLLGLSAAAEFSQTSDNWNPGDVLIFHTLAAGSDAQAEIDGALNRGIADNLLLSAQSQAEAILKEGLAAPASAQVPYPRALFAIQRII